MGVRSVEVTAPTNIAIIKYWGKRCVNLNLPLNSSLSVTLSQDHLKSTTKIESSPEFTCDEIILNGCAQNINNPRLQGCLAKIRSAARLQHIKQAEDSCEGIKLASQKVKIYTENNFPTAAGLASSASGYAALVFAMGRILNMNGDLTAIARQGSGSACRSLHGGFVQWHKGKEQDGSDSIGRPLVAENHWEELRIFVVVVNDSRKKVGSTEGMQLTLKTSELLKHRVDHVVEDHLKTACRAIKEKDFPKLAAVTMRESNQLHAVCLDTNPPLHYLNDVSFMVMDMIHSFNEAIGSLQTAYTFDAGPNACLLTTESHAGHLAWLLKYTFPTSTAADEYFQGMSIMPLQPPESILSTMDLKQYKSDLLKYIICTKIGDGPRTVAMSV